MDSRLEWSSGHGASLANQNSSAIGKAIFVISSGPRLVSFAHENSPAVKNVIDGRFPIVSVTYPLCSIVGKINEVSR